MLCEDSTIVDDYLHPSPAVVYTPWNIPGPGVDIDEFESQLVAGCNCKDGVCKSESTCSCISRFGRNYTDSGCLLESKFDGPIVECNSTCACFERGKCGNRIVQYGPLRNLQIFSTEGRGLALRSETEIGRGSFVCEYAGEVIGLQEAKLRVQSSTGMNYVFILNEHLSDGRVVKTCVDPTAIGNIGRYINHCCEPNSAIVPVRVESPVPKLCVFACRGLEAGEEISFHYGGGQADDFSHARNRKVCLCGSAKCTKYLPFDSALL